MCVDVFAIIHYRLEQKSGFQFQFQIWSRMNSTSSVLELSYILAAAGSCDSSRKLYLGSIHSNHLLQSHRECGSMLGR